MMSINFRNIAISKVKNTEYCCIITVVSNTEAIKLLQNINLTEKREHYKTKHQEQF